jgi:arylsulfatase A-like enzyme
LIQLVIDEKTLILFTSDNGPHHEGGQDPERFDPNGPLRGYKRDLYEGGIRVPLLAHWPGVVPSGAVSDHIAYNGDIFATIAEIVDQPLPDGLDSLSLLPTLRVDAAGQQPHEYLYWEFYEQGSKQAVRQGNWKAVRMPMHSGKTELYNLQADQGETNNVADHHPDIVRQMERFMDLAHEPHPNWTVTGKSRPKQASRKGAKAQSNEQRKPQSAQSTQREPASQ